MNYKAVIFDIDGTAVANEQFGKPSTLLIDTVRKAKEKAFISAATGRIYSTARWVIEPLGLTAPCIISSGAQIIDPTTANILWEKTIPQQVVAKILALTAEYPYQVVTASQVVTYPPQKERIVQDESIIYILEIPLKESVALATKLQKIFGIVMHRVIGYKKDHMTFHLTHTDATKSHAVHTLIDMLGVKKEEIIGVGDSFNDLSLFEAVGLKIAMGNAAEELKKAADEIAPPVEADGLARIIQKYILSE